MPSLMQLLGRFNWWAPRPLRALAGRGQPAALPAPQRPGPGLEHLEVTRYCDWRHSAVLAAVAGVLDGDEPDREAAIKLFRFVRDEILYEFGPWGVTASETLERRGGTCTNKANALVALLRAAGIPAAYGVLRVDARRYWGPIGPQFLTRHASSDSTHIYAAAHIERRWVRCDPSTDRQLASLTAHWNPQTRLIDWDGRLNALDFLDPAHIHADLGLHASVDDLLSKPAVNAQPDLIEYGNDYLAFIRRNPPFGSAQELITAYQRELEQRRQQQVAPR